ncbi:MAG: 50S ribosomal protein L25, partial [Methylibium sp.]|nr:50S ribosomal protein L25 [Methylibium sp.]
ASQLPEFITIDVGEMTKGQSLHVDDLKLPKGIKVVLRGKKNPAVVSVIQQAEEAEPEVVAAPVVKAPATKAKKEEKQNKK